MQSSSISIDLENQDHGDIPLQTAAQDISPINRDRSLNIPPSSSSQHTLVQSGPLTTSSESQHAHATTSALPFAFTFSAIPCSTSARTWSGNYEFAPLDKVYKETEADDTIQRGKHIAATEMIDPNAMETHGREALNIVRDAANNKASAIRQRNTKGGVLSHLLKLYSKPESSGKNTRGLQSPKLKSSNASTTNAQELASSTSTPEHLSSDGRHRDIRVLEAESALAEQLRITAHIADILSRQDFLVKLCKALIAYGAPTHKIEETCARLADSLQVDGSFAFLPGLMTISFNDTGTRTSDTHHIKCAQGMDMHKLALVHEVALRVIRNKMTAEEANAAIEAVLNSKPYWPSWITLLGWIASSAFVAPLAFQGGWTDCGAAALAGLIVGVLAIPARKWSVYANVFEVSASILVAFVARAFGDAVCFSAVALAGIVVLLPGLLLTQAIMELASRNIVSGTVRMFYALMYALFLGYGLSLGSELWDLVSHSEFKPPGPCATTPISPWFYFLVFPLVCCGINVVFGAHPKQWPGMIGVTAVGFITSYFLPNRTPQVSSVIAAFAVGITGNLYGFVTGQLAYVPLLSGVLLLVPGSIGVRGTLAFFGSDPAEGFRFAFNMVVIAMGITVGVFAASLVVYPLGRKRSSFMNF